MSAGDELVANLERALPVAPEGMVAEWNEIEVALIALARKQADAIEALELELSLSTLTVEGSTGQLRLNPIVAELRLQRESLKRTLAELRLPDAGPLKNAAKQRAARHRWDREKSQNA